MIANLAESRQVSLRVLRFLSFNLDSFILLEQKFGVTQALLNQLEDAYFVNSNGKSQSTQSDILELVVDDNSLLVNHILISTQTIGGPSERILAPLELEENLKEFMYQDNTIPSSVFMEIPGSEMEKDLFDTVSDPSEITLIYESFMKESSFGTSFSIQLFSCLIRLHSHPDFTKVESLSFANLMTGKSFEVGMDLACEYACRILFKSRTQLYKSLSTVYATITTALKLEYSEFEGFDWFIATIFVMAQGQEDLAIKVLLWIQSTSVGPLVWYLLGKGNTSEICHLVEAKIEKEQPRVASAFTLSGCTISQLVQEWTRQVFWQYLDFPSIQYYIITSLLYGKERMVRHHSRLLAYMEQNILTSSRDKKLIMLFHLPIKGWNPCQK